MEKKTKSLVNWHHRIRVITEGAIMLALAEVLSLIPLFKLPWGGSVDLAMLPVILFCIRWGFGAGMTASCAHAIFQFLFAGGISIGWQSMLGDYLIAYSVLGIAGLFKGRFVLATLISVGVRFLVHYVVGATLWAEYMPEQFFGMTMTTPWIYSALYNGTYILLDLVLILAAYFILRKTALGKYFTAQS